MNILCLGLSHNTASQCVREPLAFTDAGIKAALSRQKCSVVRPDGITEMVIVSTCNRVEIYALAAEHAFSALEQFLADVQGQAVDHFRPHLYRYSDEKAIEHLFRVAAGLDSLVLGEAQILGQITHAYELARGQDTAGSILSRLFQAAIQVGKRVRSETAIGHNPASVSSMAVRLATQTVPRLEEANVAVLGAGEMAELTVEALRKRGASRIMVVNRSLLRAQELAERWNGEAATFDNLEQVLQKSDILISSTGAPHTLIRTGHLEQAISRRPDRPLVLIDIAVPRDIEPEVNNLQGVSLYDMDALQAHLARSLESRQRQVPLAEAILIEEKGAFLEYLRTLHVLPLIAEIRQQAEMVRQAELEKTLRRLPQLSEAERERVEALTNALVKKLLHPTFNRLREESKGPYSADYAMVARALFGLRE